MNFPHLLHSLVLPFSMTKYCAITLSLSATKHTLSQDPQLLALLVTSEAFNDQYGRSSSSGFLSMPAAQKELTMLGLKVRFYNIG